MPRVSCSFAVPVRSSLATSAPSHAHCPANERPIPLCPSQACQPAQLRHTRSARRLSCVQTGLRAPLTTMLCAATAPVASVEGWAAPAVREAARHAATEA